MNTMKIVAIFASLLGVEEEKAMEQYTLCKGAEESMRLMLLNADYELTYGPLLCRAAATLAFYRYMLLKAADTPNGGYKVKDIQIGGRTDANTEAARILWYQSLADLKGIIEDTDFVFRRV